MPAPEEVDTVLGSGLRVVAVRRAEVPMVELRLRVPFADTSGRDDSAHAAVAEVLATTILSGTSSRSRVGIDDDLAGVGGEIGFSVDPERLSASGHALADGLDTLLDVLADLVLAATHPEDELARERERLVERIELASAQPSVIARRALQERRYGDAPDHARDAAARGGHRGDRRRRALAAGLGPAARAARCSCSSATSTRPTPSRAWRRRSPDGRAGRPPRCRRCRSSGPATCCSSTGRAPCSRSCGSPRRRSGGPTRAIPSLQLANLALGGYFSSRLVENLREDKGYTYHASSSLELDPHGAVLAVETDVASEVTAPALLEARYELGRLAVVPPTDDEVESARRYLVGSLLISMTTQAGYASTVAALAAHGLSSAWVREHPARLEAVTTDEVAAAAAEFFAPTRFTGVVVADAARTGPGLRALGGVEIP